MPRPPALLASLALLALGACALADAQAGTCSPEAAKRLAGSEAPSEAQAKRLTGASIVRRIAPGDPVTMDFNERRVTIEVDAGGTVVRASCG